MVEGVLVCDEPRLLVWIYDHCIFACLFYRFLPLGILYSLGCCGIRYA